MEKIDLRRKSQRERKILREQVVRQKELGLKNGEVERNTGISSEAVSRIWNAYKREGMQGISPKKIGRPIGRKLLLSAEEASDVRRAICEEAPIEGGLWTRPKIAGYIKRKYKREIDVRRISELCKKWGLSVQRPAKQAYKQDKKK